MQRALSAGSVAWLLEETAQIRDERRQESRREGGRVTAHAAYGGARAKQSKWEILSETQSAGPAVLCAVAMAWWLLVERETWANL